MKLTEVQKKWVKALRSGKYKQGKELLKEEDRFCCLGVACDIYLKAHGDKWANLYNDGVGWIYDDNTALPPLVRDWFGIKSCSGNFGDVGGDKVEGSTSLVGLNDDRGFSFEQIADVIEKNPESIFMEPPLKKL